MLPATQAGARHACNTAVDRSRSQSCFTGVGPLWEVEHRVHRTGESDGSPWNSRAGTPYLGHFSTVTTAARPSGVVASLLPFCASSPITASSARAAARARWQAAGATLPTADSSDGSGQNHPTLDSGRCPLLSLAAGPMLSLLRALEARWGSSKWQRRRSRS